MPYAQSHIREVPDSDCLSHSQGPALSLSRISNDKCHFQMLCVLFSTRHTTGVLWKICRIYKRT